MYITWKNVSISGFTFLFAFSTSNFGGAVSNSSPTRQDSASQVSSSLTYQHQPVTRPERFPQSILWTLKDAQDAHLVLESNKSRPSMEKCIRNEDGSSISVDQWRSIRLTARTIAQTDLLSLPVPNKAKATPRTKTYYKKNHIKAWWVAIQQLEERQPLLRLCAANWKADHVLGIILQARVSEAKQQLRRMYTVSDDEEERGVGDGAGGSRQKRRNVLISSSFCEGRTMLICFHPRLPTMFPMLKRLQRKKRYPSKSVAKYLTHERRGGRRIG